MSGKTRSCIDGFSRNLQNIHEEHFYKLYQVWIATLGEHSAEIKDAIANYEITFQNFCEEQIGKAEDHKTQLMENIEAMGREAVELERALALPFQVREINNDIPLLQLKTTLENLVESYRDLKAKRIEDYEVLRLQEQELCLLLDEQMKILPLPGADSTAQKARRTVLQAQSVPSSDKMEECKARIVELEVLKAEMEEEFNSLKYQLKSLLEDCEILPFTMYERFAAFTDKESSTLVPFSASNLQKLKENVQVHKKMKDDLIAEANNLRSEITKVSKHLLKDPGFLESLFAKYNGFGKKTTKALQKVLDELVDERKKKLKELILSHRTLLEDLWTKCCYSDQQKSQFKAYYADYFTEDILTFHEVEVEELEMFYTRNKRIFDLAETHRELWDRLLLLEREASCTDRLFNNRGGRLLLEEKQRKTIQKKLPAIKAELVKLLNQYKAESGTDFLYFGIPLLDTLEQMEEEREAAKENMKKQRKAANSETLRLESRLGTQPVASKRKLLAPQSNTTKIMKMSTHSTVTNSTYSSAKSTTSSIRAQKMLGVASTLDVPHTTPVRLGVGAAAGSYAMRHTPAKTPASSTPKHGSPSYESFQESLLDPASDRMCQNSTKREERVLRPRNHDLRSKTPFKTPVRTPSKTPSKIPFRIATGSKIPSVVPPISPRSAKKLTTPRTRLPIIF